MKFFSFYSEEYLYFFLPTLLLEVEMDVELCNI